MENKQYSGASARPMDERLQNCVENAGIPLQNSPYGKTDAQEQAAQRSREAMASMPIPDTGTQAERKRRVENAVEKMRQRPSQCDPNGSWTGVPENPWETPVQDADDL